MNPFTYQRVDAPDAALNAILARNAKFLGGGTNLVDLMKDGVEAPSTLVDINHIGLDKVQASASGAIIGASVRNSDLANDPGIVANYPLLSHALLSGASQQLRNMARLGGNVLQRTRCSYFRDTSYEQCNKRVPGSGCAALDGANRGHAVLGTSDQCVALYPGDWAPALVALDARVEVLGPSGKRTLTFADLHRLPGATPHVETNLAPGELITAFIVPGGPRRRSLYRKIRDRESYAFANASAAVALDLDGDIVRDVRIGLGGVATIPWRARRAEAMLRGRELTEASAGDAAQAEFKDAKTRKYNSYKVALGQSTMVRALLDAKAMEVH